MKMDLFGTNIKKSDGILPSVKLSYPDIDLVLHSTPSKGNQNKYFLYPDCSVFFKENLFYQNTNWNDNKVECLGSFVCNSLDINSISQGCAELEFEYHSVNGTYSYNFLNENEVFFTREFLVSSLYKNDMDYRKASSRIGNSVRDRLSYDIKTLSNYVDSKILEKYLLDMCLVDVIVLNEDRHSNNYGLIYNKLSKEYSIPPLFDFGTGAFEHDLIYTKLNVNQAIGKCKLKNYSSKPRKLFDYLLENNSKVELVKLIKLTKDVIPNKLYEEYFHSILLNWL